MKVLLINNFHYRRGGSEVVYFNTAEVLIEHGHSVIFFSHKMDENIPCNQEEFFVKRKGGLMRVKNYFYNSEAEKQLERLIKIEKPDIAHAHLCWGGLMPAIFKPLKKYGIPLVHTAHDYRMVCPGYTFKDGSGKLCERCGGGKFYQCAIHRCPKGNLLQSLLMTIEMYYRNAYHNPINNIDGLIFVSNFSQNKQIKYNAAFGELPHMVLYNYSKPFRKYDVSLKEDYVLYYGRLSFEKGVSTLIKAFSSHPEVNLKIIGSGPLETEMKTLCKERNARNIEFLGYKSGEELFTFVHNAKFVCVPSECYENNPMTIVESYSLGTPVIGADLGGIHEIVKDKETGFLFESGNVNSLEKAIERIKLIESEQYNKMCLESYRFYDNNFSPDVHYNKLLQFYKDILNRSK